MKAWLHTGQVLHRRLKPVQHRFRYAVFFLRFPLHRVAELETTLFSVNRFNLLSFHFADHGDGGDPLAWAQRLLTDGGIDDADGEIVLQAFPRVLGYVFNPVSFWFCHRKDGSLRAVIAEVNNTFGERHCYLLQSGAENPAASPDQIVASPSSRIRNGELLTANKVFHVSPFCAIEGGYQFRFLQSAAGVVARIDYHDSAGALLLTSVSGQPRPFTSAALLGVFLTHPLMTLGVVARIHWQALRLWIKRVPFYRKPAPPADFVTRST